MDSGRLQDLLNRFPRVTVLVVGDFFLDKYLDIDPRLSEPSLETGLETYQVTSVRRYPGAAGAVANNLRALDVNVIALGVVGEDGEGDDLRRGLDLIGVKGDGLIRAPGRFTPTYLKPMLRQGNTPARELNRFDTKNRTPLPAEIETEVITRLHGLFTPLLGIVVVDQVSEPNCGVITDRVRQAIRELARANSGTIVLADSRERIGEFRDVMLKPNLHEATRATGLTDLAAAGRELCRRTHRPVIVTHGDRGMYLFDLEGEQHIPAIPVAGPIDVVGAGDSAMAGLVAGLCAGGTLAESALVGNLAASLTIQQLGETGTATRAQILTRFEKACLP
ncbi:MAG TPA: PfkB family carbohydrate kinase [Gemmatimonadales bacterium]|nr:PfkB family carbohydrate kinase [Gemmatimonadales bacterium]